ncbi:hypothetical protein [Bacillus luti]|uniref:hypothetical protein n=1 Tax=Bacillus luti TaxID=2026191 RepID=UPI003773B5E1
MRHTRNRQFAKLHNEPMWFWSKDGTDDIRSQRLWMKMGLQPKLDLTFKWHRDFGGLKFVNVIEVIKKGESQRSLIDYK